MVGNPPPPAEAEAEQVALNTWMPKGSALAAKGVASATRPTHMLTTWFMDDLLVETAGFISPETVALCSRNDLSTAVQWVSPDAFDA
jgi:hypothetical protein